MILKNPPVISVVMSVFNGERYLAHAIEGILGQTFGDFEFLIVDDGSKDQTWQILKNYEQLDPRIRLIRNEENLRCSIPRTTKSASSD